MDVRCMLQYVFKPLLVNVYISRRENRPTLVFYYSRKNLCSSWNIILYAIGVVDGLVLEIIGTELLISKDKVKLVREPTSYFSYRCCNWFSCSHTWMQSEMISAKRERALEGIVLLMAVSTICSKDSLSCSWDEAQFTNDCSPLGFELFKKKKHYKETWQKGRRRILKSRTRLNLSKGLLPVRSSRSNTPKAYTSPFMLLIPDWMCSGAM